MVQATVSRGTTSVTIDIVDDGGALAIARDVGKPERRTTLGSASRLKPANRTAWYVSDNLSGSDRFVVGARLLGANAYSDAQTLAEDLVRTEEDPSGNRLQLDLSNVTGLGTYKVGVPDAGALELTYPPGQRDLVRVDLSVEVHGVV